MCLFLCANLTAQHLLQPTIDRSWRSSLKLCVWHADDEHGSFISQRNQTNAPARIAERLALPNCRKSIDILPVADQPCSTGADDSAELRDQATNALAEAWGRLRRWFRGRL
jgi:hypothetical protein